MDAASGVIAYRFGRSGEVDRARDSRIIVLRSPIDAEELRAAVLRSVSPGVLASPARKDGAAAADGVPDVPGEAAPRRFSNLQLPALAQASTAIDCECPHHLAQLVADLTAF